MTPVHIMTPSSRILVRHGITACYKPAKLLQVINNVADHAITLFTFQTFACGIILFQHITSPIPLVCFDMPKLEPLKF